MPAPRPESWNADRFAATFGVSREALAKLHWLERELHRWNGRINLVGPSTLPQLWTRHFADSAQLWALRGAATGTWTDLGSGAGFPGLIIALLAADSGEGWSVHLVESDRRKCAFLLTAARTLGLETMVHPARLERVELPLADVVSARALAPLCHLLAAANRFRAPGGVALFPKGAQANKELDAALKLWEFDYTLHPSVTDKAATILEIGAIHGRRPTHDLGPREPEGRGGKDDDGD